MPDYRKLRLNNIFSKEFRHILLLSFWIFYLLSFFMLERAVTLVYTPIYSVLDDIIPFCEFFLIPYVVWYVFLLFIHLYTLIRDVEAFKKLMYFLIISFGISTVIFATFPNMQELRPTEFVRDNIFVLGVKFLYKIDTNTNVLPSLHVVGSFAVLFTAWNAKGLNKYCWRLVFTFITIVISLSTIFLKQHSVLDVISGIILSFAVFPFAFILPDKLKNRKNNKSKSS